MNIILTEAQELILNEATALHNKHFALQDPEYIAITSEEYLKQLITHQIEGLQQAIGAQRDFEIAQDRKLEAARKRIGIV